MPLRVMLTTDQRNQLHDIILRKVEDVKADIERYTQMSQPVSPENAIGRISRMDAINNKMAGDSRASFAFLPDDSIIIVTGNQTIIWKPE